jgi:hypothetical protein
LHRLGGQELFECSNAPADRTCLLRSRAREKVCGP